MSKRTPSMEELLSSHFNHSMANVYTSIPATVVSVKNLGQQRIDVQPVINLRTRDGLGNVQRPPIMNVPLHMPVTKNGGLTYPIENGDSVFLIFSMRGLEVWKRSNGGFLPPSDVRQFDVRDCVAIPGIYPFSEAQNQGRKHSHSTDDVVIVHNIGRGSEVEIRLKPNGNVIVNSPTKVEVNCTDAVVNATDVVVNASDTTINSEVEINGDVVVNGQTKLNGHVEYTSGMTGSGGMDADGISLTEHTHMGEHGETSPPLGG